MNLWEDFITAVFASTKRPSFSISRKITWTGYKKAPMIDINELNAAQDHIFGDLSLWPKEFDGDERTYCNIASLRVANAVGCHDFDPPEGKDPLLADEVYNLFMKSQTFIRQRMEDCQNLVNNGYLVFAILPSWELHQNSGHICSLTPGVGDYSGRWKLFTPFCMNLGRSGTCFRRKGVNWAFQRQPEFYLWRQL